MVQAGLDTLEQPTGFGCGGPAFFKIVIGRAVPADPYRMQL